MKALSKLENRVHLYNMKLYKELDEPLILKEIWNRRLGNTGTYIKNIGETQDAFKKISEKISVSEKVNKIIDTNENVKNKIKNTTLKICEKDIDSIIKIKNRDTSNIKKIKDSYFKKYGDKCEICGFSFKEKIGENYIEMHHKISFKKQKLEKKYSSIEKAKEDFEFLCANCHVIADKENRKYNK